MSQKLSLVDNVVTRRIMVSFIVAALTPILFFGLVSFQQVSRQLSTVNSQTLHRTTKNHAMDLIEQFNQTQSLLLFLSHKIQLSSQGIHLAAVSNQKFEKTIVNVGLIAPDGKKMPLTNHNNTIPDLSEHERQDIAKGKVVIKQVKGQRPQDAHLWMAIDLIEPHLKGYLMLVELNSDSFFEKEYIEPNLLWAISQTGQTLFSSDRDISLPLEIKNQLIKTNSGQFSLKNKGIEYTGAYWKIPMKGMFSASDITVALAQPESQALEPIKEFGSIYLPVIALIILTIAFFITRLVIKYLSPLEELKMATLKIAGGDFNSRVDIQSHDEFEALADSFNEMTRRLRSQFDILSTMAEIDRHILSSLNAEDIIETTLSRLPSILFCDLISIAKVDPETHQLSDIRTRRTGQETKLLAEPVALSQSDVATLLEMQNGVIETVANGKFSAYLKALGAMVNWRYLIVPMVIDGSLSSIICVGYQVANLIPPESSSAARNFGDRIAVALSNAAWEEKLYQQAHYDALTGLPNRLVLNDRLTQEISRAKRDDSQLAILLVDLDRFKTVNDSLGHSAGDELLTQVAQIFVNCVRATDLVVRLGGDEFVIVISDLDKHQQPMTLISNITEKILASLKQTLIIAGHPMTFTASIGIAIFPDDAMTIQDLLKNADAAMYHAKQEGRANFRFYSPELNAAALENMKLEQELRGAISRNELCVFYQPKVDLSGTIVGAEALIRWQHQELGMISPAKFIPIAEQTGLIVDIGHWVLEQTCLWVNSLINQGFTPFRVSVNLSAVEFKHSELVEKITKILTKTNVDRRYIELELTESVAIGNTKASVEKMKQLKDLGITLSIDDFGTGYSSLSYLKDLPVDVIKIDQSFVRHLENDVNSQAIVMAILALSHGLGKEIVSEGVETKAQLDFLNSQGCHIYQGFLFSRPITAQDFEKLLIENALSAIFQEKNNSFPASVKRLHQYS